jgi:hypothetical protein
MKKIYLLLFIFFSQKLSAQVVITASDIGVAGDVIPMQIVNYGLGAPAIGGNMDWDFTNLSGVGNDTLRYLTPSSVSGGGAFPQSTFVLQDNIINQFMQTENGGLFLNGFGIAGLDQLPISVPVAIGPFRLTPRIRILNFPSQFGNPQSNFVSQGTSRFTFAYDTTLVLNGVTVSVDSVRINATVRVENNIVGDGTVSFVGMAEPALLQKAFQRISFTVNVRTQVPPLFPGLPPTYVWVPLPLSLPSLSNTYYRFWSPGKKAPLFEITMDSAGTTTQLARAQRYLLITNSSEIMQAANSFEVYPNPASKLLNVMINAGTLKNENGALFVYNSQGKIVQKTHLSSGIQQVDIATLPPGVYWLRLDNSTEQVPPKRLIIK